jgi:signal recognition particle subunit SRP19
LDSHSYLQPEKTHPADWENPGRVKVQIEKEGRFLNPAVTNRWQLYVALAAQMQRANPTLVPKEQVKKPKAATEVQKVPAKSKKDNKKGKDKGKETKRAPVRLPTRPPQPPHPRPPMEDRLPVHSPIVAAGVAVSALKRDLEAEKEQKKKGFLTGEEGGSTKQPKMKRVVVRGGRR